MGAHGILPSLWGARGTVVTITIRRRGASTLANRRSGSPGTTDGDRNISRTTPTGAMGSDSPIHGRRPTRWSRRTRRQGPAPHRPPTGGGHPWNPVIRGTAGRPPTGRPCPRRERASPRPRINTSRTCRRTRPRKRRQPPRGMRGPGTGSRSRRPLPRPRPSRGARWHPPCGGPAHEGRQGCHSPSRAHHIGVGRRGLFLPGGPGSRPTSRPEKGTHAPVRGGDPAGTPAVRLCRARRTERRTRRIRSPTGQRDVLGTQSPGPDA